MMQRSSWADEEVIVVEQVHSVNVRQRVRQRRSRRGGATPQCQMAANGRAGANSTKSAPWAKRVPAGNGAEESPSKKVYTHVEPLSADLQALLESPERCKEVLARLTRADQVEQHEMLMWLQNALRFLALTKGGCRIVQKFFEVSGNNSDRDLIIAELKDHIVEIYESPHGNFVLSKAVEVLPAAKNGFIITALLGRGVSVCKHRFGCRVVCRLMEHCTEEQIAPLLDEILPEAAMLARDDYGNYIVQAALEHASASRQVAMKVQLLPGFASLAMHKDGSRVAERLLDYCTFEEKGIAIRTLLQAEGEGSLVEIARSRYGSYVIAQLASLQQIHVEVPEIAAILNSNLQLLQTSQYADRVIIAFGLAPEQSQLSLHLPQEFVELDDSNHGMHMIEMS